MDNPHIHLYCEEYELKREREFLYAAFVSLLGFSNVSFGVDYKLFSDIDNCFVLWMDPPYSPPPLSHYNAKYTTVYIAIDSYKSIAYRLLLALGFDFSFHMHPLPKPFLLIPQILRPVIISHGLPAGICERLCQLRPTLLAHRCFDICFVGSLTGPNYSYRAKLLETIRKKHTVYVPSSFVSPSSVTKVYSDGVIGLSLPRSDYLQDANTRCFEVMASRSILFTPSDSELQSYGFVPGVHYFEYSTVDELLINIDSVISNPSSYQHVADAGFSKTISTCSYGYIADSILRVLRQKRANSRFGRRFALAIYYLRKYYPFCLILSLRHSISLNSK